MFNLRGDDGAVTGGLAVDTNQGWKGPTKYVATVPQVFDLLQDPQERYDIFMNNFTEHTWTMVPISTAIAKLMKTYVQYPPRKLQSMGYDGPVELSSSRNSSRYAKIWRKKASTFQCLTSHAAAACPRLPPLFPLCQKLHSNEEPFFRCDRLLRVGK